MNKEEIIDYVMNTPNNTNRMILEQMLDELGGSEMTEESIMISAFYEVEEDDGYSVLKNVKEILINNQPIDECEEILSKIRLDLENEKMPNVIFKLMYEADGSIVTAYGTLLGRTYDHLYFTISGLSSGSGVHYFDTESKTVGKR